MNALRSAAAIALALLTLLAFRPARAQDYPQAEIITSYKSDITVAKSGNLAVTETIAIVAMHDRINHGIYRDFPTLYTDKLGRKVRVRFDVSRVTLDGADAPYATESLTNGVRVKIGSADSYVAIGPHVYTISYTTNRQIGFFKDYDELYWNVTGNGWIFPIAHASAVVRLPESARIKQYAFYTGAQGADGKAAKANPFTDNAISFETTAGLQSYEGLTIAVGFDKGAVTPPSQMEMQGQYIRDNASIIVAVLGFLAVGAFYGLIWWRVGRDPERGTIIPLFAPPQGFSPAAVRFVYKMGYDRKAFAAALIDMAVKGYLKIDEEGGRYTLTRTGKTETEAGLSGGETSIGTALFGGMRTGAIELKQSNHTEVARAISGLKDSLRREYESKYFLTNSGWFILGVVLLGATGITAAALSDNAEEAGVLMTFLSIGAVVVSYLTHKAGEAWHDVIYGPGSRILNFIGAVFFTVFAVPLMAGLAAGIWGVSGEVSPLVTGCLLAGGVLAYVFYHLLKAPTALGARTLDQIEGFRTYLDTAEKERLEYLHPPEVTPQVFEKFLPYAIALDCENSWSAKFEAEAARAAETAGQHAAAYYPVWYSGNSFSRLGAGGFASAIGSSVASAAASASTAPGSSSGSGGGGFSGGGGGGGGGGGW